MEDVYAVPVKCIGFRPLRVSIVGGVCQGGDDGAATTRTMTEPLTVRWANDDPNPTAVRRVKREREETAADAIVRAEARMPPERRAAMAHLRFLARASRGNAERSGDGHGQGEGEDDGDDDEALDPMAYPDTDAQYPDEGEGGTVADTDAVDGASARRGASVAESASEAPGGAGGGGVVSVSVSVSGGWNTGATSRAVRGERQRGGTGEDQRRHRVRGARARGAADAAEEDDEHEFDPDDYPTFEVEEVGDERS